MALIKCENVSIGYEGQMVVHDLNFEINQGDYLCIVGENGSGKSTLVKSLLGLKNVDKGKIVFDDGLKQTEIGYLPQQIFAELNRGDYPEQHIYLLQHVFNNWFQTLSVDKMAAASVMLAFVIAIFVLLLERSWEREG